MATKGEDGSSEAALGLEGRQMSSAQSPQEKSLEPANPEVKAQEPIGQNPKPNQSIDDDKTSFKEPPKSNSPGVDLLAGPEEAHVENSEQELIEHEALTHVDRGDPTDVKSAEEKDIKSDKLSEETEHMSVQEKTPTLHIPESLEQEKLAEDLDESLQTTNRNTQETPSKEQEEEKGEIAQSLDPRGLSGPPLLNIPSADLSQVDPESAHVEVDPQFQGETESVDPKMEIIEEQHEEHSVVNERPKDAAIAKNEGSEAENLTQQQKEVNYVDCEKSTSIKADEQREAHKLAGEEEPREDNGTKVLESTAKDVASEKRNFNSDEVLMKDENKQDTRDSLADETPKEESTNSELQTDKSYQQSTEDKCLPKEPGINVTVGESPEDLEDTPDDNPQASSATEDTKEHQDATKGHPGNNQEDEISFTASDSEANREKTEVEGQGEHEERFNLGESAEEITQIFTDKDGSATEQQISDQDELTQETNENSAEEKRPDVTARERERNSDDLDKEASETVIVNNLVKEDAECWHSKEQTTTENIKILEITAEDATSEKETTRLHQENLLLKDDQETIVAYLGDTLKLPTDKKTLKDGEDLSFSENQEATVSLKDDIPEESPREIDDGFQASLSKEKEEDEMTTQFSAEVMNSGGTSQSLQSTTSSVDLLVASEDDTEVETTPQSLEDNCESLEKSRQEEPSVGTDTTEEEDISTLPNIEVKKAENEVNDCTPRDGEKIIPDDESSKFGKPEEAIITYTDKDAENEPEKDDNEDSEAVVQIEKEYAQDVASAENEGTFIQNLIEEPVDGNLENKIHDAITTEESSDQDKLTKGTSPKIDEEKNQDVISTKYEDEKEEAYEQLQASKPVKEETSNMNNDEQEKDLHATVPSVTQKFNESQEPSEQDGEGIVFAEDIYAEVVQQSHEGDSEDPATQIEKTSQPRSLVGDHQKPFENDQTAQENLNTSDVHSQAYQPNDQGEDRQATTHLFTKDISESQNPSEQDSEDAASPGTAYAEVSPQSQEGDNEDHGTQTDQEANRQATTALGTNDINAYQVPSDRDGEDVVATEAAYAEVTSQRHGEDSQDPDTQMEESSKPYKLDDNHQTPLVSDQSSHETLDKVDVSSQAYQPKDQEEKQQARDTNEFQEPSELDGDDIVALEDAYEEAPLQSNEGNCEDRVIQIETPSQAHTSVDDYLTPLESDHSAQESLNTIDVNSHVYQPKDREEDQQGTVPPLTKNISESQEPSDRNGENVEATEAAYTEVTSQSYQENSQDYATPMESSSKTHAPVENHQTLLVSDQSAQETLDPMDVNSQAYQSKDQEEGQQATTSLVTKDNNESQEPSEQDGSDVVVLEPTYEEVTPQSNEGDSQDHAVQIETPSQPHTFVDDYQTPLDLDQSTQERLNTTYANLQAYQPKDHEEDEQVTGSSVAQDIKESQEPSERDGKYIVVPEATYAEVPQQSHERDSHDFPTQMEAPSQPQIMIDENQTPLESDHSTQETLNITDEPQELNELLIPPGINEPQELNEQDGEEVVASEADYAEGLLQCSERDIDDPNTQREAPSQPHNLVENYQNTSESDNNAQEILNTTDDNSQAIQPKDHEEPAQTTITIITPDINKYQKPNGPDGEGVVTLQSHERSNEDLATRIEAPSQPYTLVGGHENPLESNNTQESLNTEDVNSQVIKPIDHAEDRQAAVPRVTQDENKTLEPNEPDGEVVAASEATYAEVLPQSHEENIEAPATQMKLPSQPHTPFDDQKEEIELKNQKEEIESVTTSITRDIKESEEPSDRDDEDVVVLEATYTEVPPQSLEGDNEAPTTQTEIPAQPHTPIDDHSNKLELDHSTQKILYAEDGPSRDFQPTDQKEAITTLFVQDINESKESSERDSEDVMAVEAAYEEVPPHSHEEDSEAPTIQMELPSQPHALVDDHSNKLELYYSTEEILYAEDVPSQAFQPIDQKEETESVTTSVTRDIKEAEEPNEQDDEDVVVLEAPYTEVPPQSLKGDNEAPATHTEIPAQPHTPVDDHSNKLELDHSTQEFLYAEDGPSRDFQPTNQKEEIEAITTYSAQDIKESKEPSERDSEDVMAVEVAYEEVPPHSHEEDSEAPTIQMELPSQPHALVDDHSNKLELYYSTEEILHAEDIPSQAFQPIDQKEETESVTTSVTRDIKEAEEPNEQDDEDVVVLEAPYTEVPPQSLKGDNEAPATHTEIPAQPHTPVDDHSNKLELDHSTQEFLYAEDGPSRDFQPTNQKEEIEAITTYSAQDIKETKEPSERESEDVMVVEAAYEEVPPHSHVEDSEAPPIQMELPSQPHALVDDHSNKLELYYSTEEILHAEDVPSQAFQPIDQKEEIESVTTSVTRDIKEAEEPNEQDDEDVVALEAPYTEVPPQSLKGDNEALATHTEIPAQPHTPVDDHSNKLELDHSTQEFLYVEDGPSRDFQPTDQKEEIEAITTYSAQDIKESKEPSEPDGEVVAAFEATYAEVFPQSHEENNEAPATQMELPSQPHTPFDDHSNKVESDHRTEESLHAEDIHSRAFQPIDQTEKIEAVTTSITRDFTESEEPTERDDEDIMVLEATNTEVPPQSLEGDNEPPAIQTEIPAQPHTPVDDHSNKLELDHSTQEILYAEDVHSQDFQPTNQKEEIEAIITFSTQDIKESEEPSERDSEDVMAVEEVPLQSHEGDSEIPAIQMELSSQPHASVDDYSNKPIDQKEEIDTITTSFTRDIKESQEPSDQNSEDVMAVEAAYEEVPPQSDEGDSEVRVTQMEVPSQPLTPMNDHSNKLESDHSTEEILRAQDDHSRAFQPIDQKEEREVITTSVTQNIKEPEELSERDSEDVMVVQAVDVEVPPQSHEGDSEAPTIQLEVSSQPRALVNDHLNKLETDHNTKEISHAEDAHSRAFQPMDHKEEREATTTSVTQYIKESEEPSEQDSEDDMAVEAAYVEVPPLSHKGGSEAPATKIEVPSQPHAPVDDHQNKLKSDYSTDETLHAEDYHSQAFQPTNQLEEREATTTSVAQDTRESKEPSKRDGEDCVAPDAANVELSQQSYDGNNEDPAAQIGEPTQPHILLDDQQIAPEFDQSTQENLNIEYAHSQAIHFIDQKEEHEAITHLVEQDIKESREPSERDGEDVVAPETAYVEATSTSHEGNSEDPPIHIEIPSQQHTAANDHQNKLESHQSTEDRLNTMDVHSQAVHPKDQENQQVKIPIITLEINKSKEANEHGVESVVPEVAYVEESPQSREEDTEDLAIQMEVPSQPHTRDDDHQHPLESDHIGQESLNTEDVNSEAFQPKKLEEIHQTVIPLATEGINELQHPNRLDGEGIAAPQRHTRVNEDPTTQMEAPSQPHTLMDDSQNPLELEHGYQESLNIENVNSQAFKIKDQEEDQQAKIPSITQDINESEGANEQDGEGIMVPEFIDSEVTPQSHNGDFEGPATDPREDMSMDESTSMALTDKTKGEKTEQDIPGQYETQLTVPSEETPSPGKAAEEDKDEDGGYGSPEHQEFKNSTKGNTAEKSTSAQIENESAKTAAISMDESSELEKLNEKTTLSDVDQEYSNVTEEILNLTNFTNEMADTPIQNTQDPAILQKGGPTCDSNLGQLTEEISPSRINKDEKFTDQEELTEEPSEHSIQENRQHIIATEHEKNSKDDLKEEADEPLEMNQVKEEAEHHHSQEQPREDHATNVPEALSGDVIPELENELLNEDKDNTISLPNDTAEKIEPETECPLQMSVDVKCLKKDTDRYSELPQAIDDGKTQDKETLGCNEDLVLLEGKGTTVESQDETLEENETKKQEPNEEQQTVLSEESLDQGKQPEETKLEHIDDEEERRDVIITETEKYSPDDLKEEACDPLDGHKLVKEETEHLQSDQPREDHVNNVPASEAQNAASETKASDINRAEIYPQSMLPCENQEAPIYLEAMLMENNDSIQKEPEHKDLAPRDQVTLERDLLGQALIEDHFSQEISNTTEENSQASLSSEQEENRLATMQLSETQETDKPPTLNDLVQPLEETYVEVDKQNLQQDGEDLANQVEAPSSGESTMRGSVDTDKGEDTNQNKNSSVVPTVEPMKEESEAKERGQYEEEQTVPNEEGVNLGETVEEATSTYTDKEKGADGHPTEEEGEEERAKDADISKNKDFTFDNFSKEMAHESTLMKEDTDVPEENKGDATQNFSISEQENLTEAREKSVEEKKQDAVSAEQAVSDLGKEAKEDINSFEGKENSSEHEGSEEITTVQIEKEDVKDATFTEHKEFNLVDDIINPSAQKETTHGPAIKEENESAMPTVSNLIEESTEGCLEKEKTEDLIVTQEESNPVILTEEMAQSQINKDKSKEIIFTKQESLDEEKLPGEASTAHSEEEKSQVDTVPEQEKICTDDLKERAEEPLEVNKLIEEETVHKIPTGHPTPDHDAKILEINEKKDEIISLVDKTLKEDATQSTEPKVVPRSDSPNSVITLEPEEVKDEGTINSEAEKAYMQPQENQGNEKDESQVIIMSIENQEVQSSIVSEATARNVLLTENLEGKGNISDVTIMKKVEESDVHKQDLEATAETSPIQTEMAEDNGLQSIKENQNFNEDEQAVEKGRTQVEGEGESREVKPIAEESIEVQEIDESQVDKNQQMGLVHLPVSQLLVNLILKEEGDKQYGFEEDTKGGFKGEENIKQQENSDPSLDKEGEMEEPKSQDLISAISEDTLILKDQDSKVVLPSREILINIAKNDGLTSEISHEIPKDEKKNETAEKSETEEEVNNIEFVNSNLEIKEKSDATMSSENINQVGNEASTILEDQRSDKQKTESISDGGKPSSADKVLPSSDKLIDIAKNKGLVFEISQEAPQGEKKNSTAEKGETACEVRDTDFEYSAPETKEKSDVITSAENLPQVYNETLILEDQGIDNQNSEKNSGGKSSSADIVLPSSETLIDIARDEGMVLEISHEVPQDEKKNATEEKSKTEGEVKDEEFANSTQEIIEKSDVITMSESPTQVYNEDSLILEDQDSNKQNTESNIDGGKTSKTDVLLPGPEILIDTAQDEGLVPEKKIETEESGETGHEIKDKDTIKPVPETKENSDALLLSKTVNNDIHQEKEVQKSDTISENHPRIEIQNKALMRDLLSETIETETSQSQGSEKALLRAQNPTPEPKSPVTEVNKVEGEASELKLEGKERTPVDDRKDRKTDELYSGERAAEEINETEPTDRDFHKQEMTMEGKDLPMCLEKSSKDATQDGSEEEKSDEGEERDEEEHKADKSAMDVSEKVETTEGDPKSPHKKSHNILSGVTSKVKHSIAKVKKAITGKPSHSKSPVAKEHT